MKLSYRVHRVSQHTQTKLLKLADNSEVSAAVPVYIVELVPVGQESEAGTLRLALPAAPGWTEGATIEFIVQEA